MELNEKLSNYISLDIDIKNSGECNITCELNDKWIGNVIEKNKWSISFTEDNSDETTIEDVEIEFTEILKFMTIIQYYIKYKDELITITSNTLFIHRNQLNEKTVSMYPFIIAYRTLD